MSRIYRPKELLQFLQTEQLAPLASLSQNFLVDGNILRKIVATAAIQPGDWVVEIGPGPGALTQCLLEAGARVLAVEKDRGFAAKLPRLASEGHELHVIEGDALALSFPELLRPHLGVGEKAKVVANLPYSITSPLLDALAPHEACFSSATLMVQKEVALRLVAQPGTHDFSSLSLFASLHWDFAYQFSVSPQCFFPKPTVTSAVIHGKWKRPPEGLNLPLLQQLIRTAFQQRRKMLRTSLQPLYDKQILQAAFTQAHISESTRPEQLSLDNWIALTVSLEACPQQKS